jgi:hypothetical protein
MEKNHKFKKTLSLIAIVLVWYANAATGGDGIASEDAAHSICLVDKAIVGDKVEARKCSDAYIKDIKLRRYWTKIAAENGDKISQYNYAVELLSSGNRIERLRAQYWLRLSAGQGNEMARELLQDVIKMPDMTFPPPPPPPPPPSGERK